MTVPAPGYWLHETGPVLRPAIWAYLRGGELDEEGLAAIRDYLRQWVGGDWWGAGVDELRGRVEAVTSRQALDDWLAQALELGIDPL